MNETNSARAARVLAALGKAIAYAALFWGFQTLVSVVFVLAVVSAALLATGGLDLLPLLRQVQSSATALVLVSNLLTLFFLLIFFAARRKHPLEQTGLRPVPAGMAAAGAAVAPLFYAAVTLVLSLLPAAWLEDYAQASASLTQFGLIPFVSTALVAPLAEEVIFRGWSSPAWPGPCPAGRRCSSPPPSSPWATVSRCGWATPSAWGWCWGSWPGAPAPSCPAFSPTSFSTPSDSCSPAPAGGRPTAWWYWRCWPEWAW